MKILIPLFASLFFIIGHLVTKFFKEKENMLQFSIGIAFITLLGITIFDLFPEVLEIYENFPNQEIIIFGFIVFGFVLFGFLDSFTHHHHNHEEHHTEEKIEDHLFHIGLTTTIAIALHNLVEGVFIYMGSVSSIKTGMVLAVAVGLHNIPLGMQISSSLELSNRKKISKFIIFTILVLSTFIGGLMGMFFELNLNIYILGAILALTTGMTLYITFFELLREIIFHKNKKQSFYGIICGIILMIIASLI